MHRLFLLIAIAGVALAGCAASGETPAPKVRPSADARSVTATDAEGYGLVDLTPLGPQVGLAGSFRGMTTRPDASGNSTLSAEIDLVTAGATAFEADWPVWELDAMDALGRRTQLSHGQSQVEGSKEPTAVTAASRSHARLPPCTRRLVLTIHVGSTDEAAALGVDTEIPIEQLPVVDVIPAQHGISIVF